MNINEAKLKEYIEMEEITEYETDADFLDAINTERTMFWSQEYPEAFTDFETIKRDFAGEYVFNHNGKFYWILNADSVDVYE